MKSCHRGWIVAAGLLLLAGARGNEPSWTPQERLEQRSHVFQAKVTALKKLDWKSPTEGCYWMEASVEIGTVTKGETSAKAVYYLTSDQPGRRCPTMPALTAEKSYRMYCTERAMEGQKRLTLEMGSDAMPLNPP